ncbi:MAG TPA: twin-arginine translocation signal domain-containing protein, partial [bacterium]|nr:twin-arginine translocation signal domain-containing protein [bacterium]
MNKSDARTATCKDGFTRRDFLKTSMLAGVGTLAVGCKTLSRTSSTRTPERPNIVLVLVDQLSLDAISAHGCPYA